MAKVKVHYANFDYLDVTADSWSMTIKKGSFWGFEHITGDDIARIEVVTEQMVKRAGSAVSWGIIGGAIAGPAGAIAGVLLGGNGRETTFILETEDGKTLIGTAETHIFNALLREKLCFDELRKPVAPSPEMEQAEREYQAVKEESARLLAEHYREQGRPVALIDEEKEMKVGRVLREEDYRAWKERTGEIHELRAYAESTRYIIPDGMTL
jgi:hypothetical protein